MTQTDAIVFVINYIQTLFRSASAHWSATSWIPPDVLPWRTRKSTILTPDKEQTIPSSIFDVIETPPINRKLHRTLS